MRSSTKRALSALAAIGLSAALLPVLGGTAGAAPGAQPPPTLTPNPVPSRTSAFALSTGTCDGTAGQGWRVQTYIVDHGTDIGALAFDEGFPAQVGEDRDATDGSIRSSLWKGDAPGTGYLPAASPAGQINPSDLAAFDFSESGWQLVDGVYDIGYACMDPSGAPAQWWTRTVTIDADATPNAFMREGVAAPAPTITSVTTGDGRLTVTFDGTGADSWTAQASTTAGDFTSPVGTSTTATSPGSVTISGLANGTPHHVRVLAHKAGFAPTPSAQSGPHTPAAGAQPPVRHLTVDPGPPGSTQVILRWDAPDGGLPVAGYDVTIDPGGGVVDVDAVTRSATITGLESGSSYTCTVTPTYTDPSAVGTPASASCTPTASGVTRLTQDITVVRPAGALVFTQRCENTLTGVAPEDAPFAAAPCALDFGTARLRVVGSDVHYFAQASLNNVRIDATGDDVGWRVTGDVSDELVAGPAPNQRMSGDQIGWAPQVVGTSAGLTAQAGAPILPGTANGLTGAPTLASSPAGASLGIAELDAVLQIVIPIQKRAGTYTGTLTMTATPGA